jgi:hypothetical protein
MGFGLSCKHAGFLLLGWCLASIVTPTQTPARTWHVPSECLTIKAGLDSASYGDTVLVAPGTYLKTDDPETRISPGPGVALVSEQGPEATIIEFCNSSTGIGLSDCEGARVSGFTVRFVPREGCGFPGGWLYGINCARCTDVIVEDCVIEDVGYGIRVNWESQEWCKPLFRNITIRNCTKGVSCQDVLEPSRPLFEGVSISHCDVGVEVWNSEPNFESCEITYCNDYGMVYIGHCGGDCDKCVIARNENCGVYISSDPPLAAPGFNGSWLPENANDFYDNGSYDIWYEH